MRINFVSEHRMMGTVLRLVAGISIILMAAGMVMYLAGGGAGTGNGAFVGMSETLAGAMALEPVPMMTLGLVILLFTPVLRVMGALFSFLFAEKDPMYALISLGVLIILVVGMFLPSFK